MDNSGAYSTDGFGQCSQCSDSIAVMPAILNTQEANPNIALGGSPNLPILVDDSETEGSSQEEESLLTPPVVEKDVPLGWNQVTCVRTNPSDDRGSAKNNEDPKQDQEPRAVHSPTYRSGQYFQLAHEYAESAHAAAQVKLRYLVTSLECDASNYSTGYPWYYPATTAALDGQQRYNVHAQVYSDLFGIPEIETGNELGWTFRTWNSDSYGEPGEVERFCATT